MWITSSPSPGAAGMSKKTSRHRTRAATRKKGRGSRSHSEKQPRKERKSFSPDPVILLHVLARMLNECDKAGIHPKLKHGIIYTDAGFVLPVKDDKWAARPLR